MSGFPTDPSTVKVVVVGAGVCGLTAAHELVRRGFEVEVYEAGHYAGGLAWSKTAGPKTAGPPTGNEELSHYPKNPPQLPVEHGFRFFPGFYRHLFDSMSRTPLPAEPHCCGPVCNAPQTAGGTCSCCATVIPVSGLCPICTAPLPTDPQKTTADRLIAVTTQGVALEDGREYFTYSRQKNADITETLDELAIAADYLGASAQDIARLMIKFVEYLTTSPERRADLENISWWDFLGGTEFSPRFAQYIDRVPRALVGMSARESDARTQGTIVSQLMLDQMSDGSQVDRVLDGPTIERWIDPWVTHLESMGVTFHWRQILTHFTLVKIPPSVTHRSAPYDLYEATFSQTTRFSTPIPPTITVEADIFVLAIPMDGAHKLLSAMVGPEQTFQTTTPQDTAPSYPDLGLAKGSWVTDDSIERLVNFPKVYFPDPDPNFVWMFGMQFFMRDDLPILHGHLYYPDSAFGLSSISQPQFWADDYKTNARWGQGLIGGAMSVDIGDWGTKVPIGSGGAVEGKTAAECTKEQLATEVWRQLALSLDSGRYHRQGHGVTTWEGKLPAEPLYWFVGEELQYAGNVNPPKPIARAPFLINRPKEYNLRPGTPGYYRVHLDQFVMAGNWMRTHTRLDTMEAANESARHAVNAILRHYEFQGDECTIWNPEHCEPGAFNSMQDLDAKLHAAGLPHVFNALGVYCGIKTFVPSGCAPTLLTCASLVACMGKPGTSGGCGPAPSGPGGGCGPAPSGPGGGCGPTPSGPLNGLMKLLGVGPDMLASIFGVDVGDLVAAEEQVVADQAQALLDAEQSMLDHVEGRAIPRHKPSVPRIAGDREEELLLRLGFKAQRRTQQQEQQQQLQSEQRAVDGPAQKDDPTGFEKTVTALEAWSRTADPAGLDQVNEARAAGEVAIANLRVDLSEADKDSLRFQLAEAAWELRIIQGQDLAKSPLIQAFVKASKEAEALLPSLDRVPKLGAEEDDTDRRSTLQELFPGPLQPLTGLYVPGEPKPSIDHRKLLKKLPQPKRRRPTRKHPLSKLLAALQNPS